MHTGGTIASKVDYKTGGVSTNFAPEDLISMFPVLKDLVNIETRLVRNMWSESIRFPHYNLLAKEVEKEIKKGKDGVIITHGTDTLAYSSAALSFILEDINIPVILVGAQRSSDRGSSDAGFNLIKAAKFIAETDFVGVSVCMHENSSDDSCLLFSPCKIKKLHSSRRDAFKTINGSAIARISEHVEFFINHTKKGERKLKLKLINEKLKIGVLTIHPNMFASEIKAYSKFNGLIIEGTGLGHMPVDKIDNFTLENNKIYLEIKKLAKKIPVVMITQTIFGRVNMNVYEPGIKLQQAGVLGNLTDLTLESAFIKLAWLLSNEKKSLKKLWDENLRGELTSRTEFEKEIIK